VGPSHRRALGAAGEADQEITLALISSGGFEPRGQPPFENGVRLPLDSKTVDVRDLRIHHHGYSDDDVDRDPNCVFPMDRLRELETVGAIGELADVALSFVMVYSPRREIEERAPRMIAELKARNVDAVLLVPV
jgi:D-proline reductase (dithiol) PrdB